MSHKKLMSDQHFNLSSNDIDSEMGNMSKINGYLMSRVTESRFDDDFLLDMQQKT